MNAAIELKDVTYTYPFATKPAINHLNLSIKPGEVVVITGQSGRGKSTLIRLINGLSPHYYGGELTGEVLIDGKNNADRTIAEIAADVGTLFQDPEEAFFTLRVRDEIGFINEWQGKDREETANFVLGQAKRFGVTDILDQDIHDLSEGQKQKVGLATCSGLQTKALILDEPSANLDPDSIGELARTIAELKAAGIAVLIVDHRLHWFDMIVDRLIVMHDGQIVFEGNKDSLTHSFCEEYGLRQHRVEDVRERLPQEDPKDSDAVLSAVNITFAHPGQAPLFKQAAFALTRGVTALIGENGSGKTTLARIFCGLNSVKGGDFYIKGEKINPNRLLEHVAIVLQNADHQLHMRTVQAELEMSCLMSGLKDPKARIEELLEFFDLMDFRDRHPHSLSGGQKQRLAIAAALVKDPEILILDEPTSGLDGQNMQRIATLLNQLAEQGKAVLVITHDLELVKASCTKCIRLEKPL